MKKKHLKLNYNHYNILDEEIIEDELLDEQIFITNCFIRKEQLTSDFFNVEEELDLYVGEL